MIIVQLLGVAALATIARFVFLFFAAAVRDCRWCTPKSRFCLRCHGEREHLRIGARSVHRARLSVAGAVREWRAGR